MPRLPDRGPIRAPGPVIRQLPCHASPGCSDPGRAEWRDPQRFLVRTCPDTNGHRSGQMRSLADKRGQERTRPLVPVSHAAASQAECRGFEPLRPIHVSVLVCVSYDRARTASGHSARASGEILPGTKSPLARAKCPLRAEKRAWRGRERGWVEVERQPSCLHGTVRRSRWRTRPGWNWPPSDGNALRG